MNTLLIFVMFYWLFVKKVEVKNFEFKPLLILRNTMLRLLISKEFIKTKTRLYIRNRLSQKNMYIFYNKIISKYYDVSYEYYTLSHDDKSLLESVVSLSY